MVASCRNRGVGCHRAHPARARIVRHRTVAVDKETGPEVFAIVRPTMRFQLRMASIYRPGPICDLAADESFIPGLADAERDVGLTFGQIKSPVADHEFDPKTAITCVKSVDEWRPP